MGRARLTEAEVKESNPEAEPSSVRAEGTVRSTKHQRGEQREKSLLYPLSTVLLRTARVLQSGAIVLPERSDERDSRMERTGVTT